MPKLEAVLDETDYPIHHAVLLLQLRNLISINPPILELFYKVSIVLLFRMIYDPTRSKD